MKNCKWCNDEVKNSNADECDRCWEIRWQCEVVPELVAKILSASNNVCSGRGLESPQTEYIYSDNPNVDEGDK